MRRRTSVRGTSALGMSNDYMVSVGDDDGVMGTMRNRMVSKMWNAMKREGSRIRRGFP